MSGRTVLFLNDVDDASDFFEARGYSCGAHTGSRESLQDKGVVPARGDQWALFEVKLVA